MNTQWVLFIEEFGSHGGSDLVLGNGTHVYPQVFNSRDEAQQVAAQAAYMHKPGHHLQEQGRRVMRESFDSYVVLVEGAMRKAHFRVTVVEELLPGEPAATNGASPEAQLARAQSESNLSSRSRSLR